MLHVLGKDFSSQPHERCPVLPLSLSIAVTLSVRRRFLFSRPSRPCCPKFFERLSSNLTKLS